MNKIRDAVILYQKNEGHRCENLEQLVPKYLPELAKDPWGITYTIIPSDGVVISAGPDRKMKLDDPLDPSNRDNLIVSYLPPMAIIDARQSIDINGNGLIDNNDIISISFNKPPVTPAVAAAADFEFVGFYDDNSCEAQVMFGTTCENSTDSGLDPSGKPLNNAGIGRLELVEPAANTIPGELGGKYDQVHFRVKRDPGIPFKAELFVRFSQQAITPRWNPGKYADKRKNLPPKARYNIIVRKPGENEGSLK
ncbi:MAG: hypothetical protein PHW04_13140 [Candidatus Wallbacteria bacterium]|nr:hypothetical protein [Candidatus Wallbacteria bacterium]